MLLEDLLPLVLEEQQVVHPITPAKLRRVPRLTQPIPKRRGLVRLVVRVTLSVPGRGTADQTFVPVRCLISLGGQGLGGSNRRTRSARLSLAAFAPRVRRRARVGLSIRGQGHATQARRVNPASIDVSVCSRTLPQWVYDEDDLLASL